MIFDLLTTPKGVGRIYFDCCTPHLCEQLTHQIWLDFVQRFRRKKHNRQTDRHTEAITIFSHLTS